MDLDGQVHLDLFNIVVSL